MKNQNLDTLLGHFKKLRAEMLSLIDNFPPTKRLIPVFGKWNLKDVLAHMNHWAIHDINCLDSLQQGTEPYFAPNVDHFNEEGVKERRDWSWAKVYEEFLNLSKKLVNEYENLTDDLWDKKFWSDRKFTPRMFLKIDIDHYENEHIPELKKFLPS